MALQRANISWTAKQVTKMANNGALVFDNVIQRSYVWEVARKSNLIHSMIEGYPIPPFYARRVDGKKYDFLDGKQRMNAIRGYINGEYALTGIPEVSYTDAEGNENIIYIGGMKFDELPEELQDAIKDYSLTIYYYDNITPEQVRVLFTKLNNGKPLSTKEKNIAYCTDIKTVSELGNHPLFMETFTEKAKDSRKQLPIVMKIWVMLNEEIEDISFASKDFNPVMTDTIISDEEKNDIVAVLNKAYDIYNEVGENNPTSIAKEVRRKMVSETHLVSLAPFFKWAIDNNINDKLTSDFMVELFYKNLVSDEYAEACKNGCAKNANIAIRHKEIEKKCNEFFREDNEYEVSDDINDVDDVDDVTEVSDNVNEVSDVSDDVEDVTEHTANDDVA